LAKPINVFKNNEQFLAYAKDWQHKLFLDNWNIEFRLTEDPIKLVDNDCDTENLLWGFVDYSFENSSALITVFNSKVIESEGDFSNNMAELTLVHELLHLKVEYIIDDDIIGKLPKIHQSLLHQEVEAMAKSLIMAKYGLDYAYFNDNVVVSSTSNRMVR
jgi:hypothetical protein